MSRVRRSGQSLVEVLVGIAIAAIFIIGAAAVVAPSLQENKQTSQLQMKAELADELMGNVRSWAGGNWNSVLSLATGTANPYYLNTNVSPFTPSATSTAGTTTSTAAIALVQSASSSADYSSSAYSTVSATFPSNTSSGDAIVVFLQHDSGSGRAVTGCRDSVDATSSYLLAARANNTGNSQESELWYAQNITGGTTPTVTCTFSTNTPYDSIAIQEYRGIATTSALDATSTNIVTSASTALTTGTSTTHF
ncbi:MAG TPA: prepilin-type N-terminal cleavage/methylation domain-containing protein, partial [Candidatus Paceibacterota bacterium]|nr:prepilin-type N-terminal cleavage/methylation domain-containing protein [Candidatus Paceibacterota bacterium]